MNDAAPSTTTKAKTSRAKPRRGVEMTLDHGAVLDACAEHVRRMFPGHLVTVEPFKGPAGSRVLDVAVTAMIIKPRVRKAKVQSKET